MPTPTQAPAAEPPQADSLIKTAIAPSLTGAKARVVVIPFHEAVDSPQLFIVRRGLKEAIEQKADLVVLDMKTPGGALDATFEIMEALAKFPGQTITFINSEALSAGAFISATTHEIWFAPDGVIGAAAPVQSTGQEIDESMRLKVVSYLKARMRATSEGKGYRGEVISAMIDQDYELKIGEKVLKGKGELLSLTASEASMKYGEPPQPLLAAGIARDITDLLTQKLGAQGFEVKTLEVTWSERLAVFLRGLAPLLLGAGLLALYAEFKTPGFGVFGITGIVLLAIVFLSNFVAGLSGHEPMLAFGLGVVLVAVELFFFPGIMVVALGGVALMFVALLWSMADLWPNEPISLAWSTDVLTQPIITLALGVAVAVALGFALMRFLPQGWWFERLAVTEVVGGAAQRAGGAIESEETLNTLIGATGLVLTPLRPSGTVEINGRRYPARAMVGAPDVGARVLVRRVEDFGLVVEALA